MLEEIINSSVPLIWKIAKNFYNVPSNDLYQAGVLGVIKAYNHYKSDGKTKFSTYAYNYIFGEMYLLANNKDIRLNKDVLKLLKMIEKGKSRLAQVIMREPSKSELANYLEMDEKVLETVLGYKSKFISMDDVRGEVRDLHEVISDEENLSVDEKIMLKDSINSLSYLEKDIINSRYFEDLTQSETARKLGITQVMVSRYEQRSLKKMREFMYM